MQPDSLSPSPRLSAKSSRQWEAFLVRHPDYERSVPKALLAAELIYLFAKYYCHLQVEGIENIPYGKRFVWTHNHSGWNAIDAPLAGYLIARNNRCERFHWDQQHMGRLSQLKGFLPELGDWGISFWHDVAIRLPLVKRVLKAFHGQPVSTLHHPENLKDYRIYVTPAEGEDGAFKSSFKELYHLKRFRTGVARLAFEADVDYILPVAIVGPEETFPNLGSITLFKKLIGAPIPLPLPIPPLPVQWIVSFLKPIPLSPFRRRFGKRRGRDNRADLYRAVMEFLKERIEDEMERLTLGRKPFRPWMLNGHSNVNRQL